MRVWSLLGALLPLLFAEPSWARAALLSRLRALATLAGVEERAVADDAFEALLKSQRLSVDDVAALRRGELLSPAKERLAWQELEHVAAGERPRRFFADLPPRPLEEARAAFLADLSASTIISAARGITLLEPHALVSVSEDGALLLADAARSVKQLGHSRTLTVVAMGDDLLLAADVAGRRTLAHVQLNDPRLDLAALKRILRTTDDGAHAVFIDDSALPWLRAKRISTEGWRFFRGNLATVEVWSGVRAAPEVKATLERAAAAKIPTGKRRIVNLIDDPSADALAADLFAADEILAIGTRPATIVVETMFAQAGRGSVLLILSHIDDGFVAASRLHVSLYELTSLGRKHGVLPVVVGCNSAEAGSGVLGQVRALPAMRRVASALRAEDVRSMLTALGTDANPFIVDTAFVRAADELALTSSKQGTTIAVDAKRRAVSSVIVALRAIEPPRPTDVREIRPPRPLPADNGNALPNTHPKPGAEAKHRKEDTTDPAEPARGRTTFYVVLCIVIGSLIGLLTFLRWRITR